MASSPQARMGGAMATSFSSWPWRPPRVRGAARRDGAMAGAVMRGKQRRAQAFGGAEMRVGDCGFGGVGVGEREIQACGGSRPLTLGEGALLQPVVAHRFGVGGEGEGAFCKFHAL
jgi:hypothetical protein